MNGDQRRPNIVSGLDGRVVARVRTLKRWHDVVLGLVVVVTALNLQTHQRVQDTGNAMATTIATARCGRVIAG